MWVAPQGPFVSAPWRELRLSPLGDLVSEVTGQHLGQTLLDRQPQRPACPQGGNSGSGSRCGDSKVLEGPGTGDILWSFLENEFVTKSKPDRPVHEATGHTWVPGEAWPAGPGGMAFLSVFCFMLRVELGSRQLPWVMQTLTGLAPTPAAAGLCRCPQLPLPFLPVQGWPQRRKSPGGSVPGSCSVPVTSLSQGQPQRFVLRPDQPHLRRGVHTLLGWRRLAISGEGGRQRCL